MFTPFDYQMHGNTFDNLTTGKLMTELFFAYGHCVLYINNTSASENILQ